ncbi:glucan 1,3-beta-glucosidase A [Spatholobus suberectus]|nr:glucan 1,3-beta-glucosidase A [Spatholobus suberectus]
MIVVTIVVSHGGGDKDDDGDDDYGSGGDGSHDGNDSGNRCSGSCGDGSRCNMIIAVAVATVGSNLLSSMPFQIKTYWMDGTSLQFKSVATGKYLSAKSGEGNILLANGLGNIYSKDRGDGDCADFKNANGWGNDDPTIFEMTIVATMQGEFQVTNGYGPIKAPQIMKEHWSTFIVQDDFKFMASHGLDAARIPVGWWIASDPTPPQPYVGGSLHALDNAF